VGFWRQRALHNADDFSDINAYEQRQLSKQFLSFLPPGYNSHSRTWKGEFGLLHAQM